MEQTKIQDMRNRCINALSKGYKQRVGIAQALLGNPKVIILDEPTVGLDPKQVVEIRALIRHLAKEHTVLLSSHILSEIRAVCDHVLILRKGKVMACDTPEALEEKLSAGGTLELTVRGSAEAVRSTVLSVDGITACEAQQEGDTVRMEISADGDARESLFYAFAQARQPILEMRPKTATLEEVFLDLTDEDDAVAAQAAALLVDTPAQTEETTDAEQEGTGDESGL